MKANFLVLSVADLLLMATTAATGLLVEDAAGYARHFALGVLTAMFTCFVHVVTFMYFVVQQKILDQAARAERIDRKFFEQVAAFKRRALRLSVTGMTAIIGAAALGGAIETGLPPSVHLVAAFAAVGIHLPVFAGQFGLLAKYREVFRQAFGE